MLSQHALTNDTQSAAPKHRVFLNHQITDHTIHCEHKSGKREERSTRRDTARQNPVHQVAHQPRSSQGKAG
jgi:hypothetical protein